MITGRYRQRLTEQTSTETKGEHDAFTWWAVTEVRGEVKIGHEVSHVGRDQVNPGKSGHVCKADRLKEATHQSSPWIGLSVWPEWQCK